MTKAAKKSVIVIMVLTGVSALLMTPCPSRTESATQSPLAADIFTRVTEGAVVNDGGWSFGVSWVDYDNDDYPDIFVWNDEFGTTGELNYMYHNNGDGTYSRVNDGVISAGGGTTAGTWADFDNDGDVDGYATNWGQLNYFYINNGDGTFTQSPTGPLGIIQDCAMEAEWVDYDIDGFLDLFVVNHKPPSEPTAIITALYHNDGGDFAKMDNSDIGLIEDEGNSTAWGDYDNDGDRDLFWSRNEKNTLFFDNDGDGTFTQVTDNEIVKTPRKYHGNWADFDNDGDLDIYAGSGYPAAPALYVNDGTGDFTLYTGPGISGDVGYWTGGYWGDYDNDGYLDLLVLGHYYYEPYPNRLYHNNGDGTFTRIQEGVIATDEEPSSAAAWADHDLDGDLDLFIGNVNNYNNTLYINNGNSNNWIEIKCLGTLSNRSAVGAKVRLKATINGESFWQLREVAAKNGFKSQGPLIAHFGLGDAAIIDTIRVEWPSGIVDILTGVGINQLLEIEESYKYGDANGDGEVNVGDAVYIINFVFKGGPAPEYYLAGDANCDEQVNVGDAVYIINYVFKGGPEPDCSSGESVLEIPHGLAVTIDGVLQTDEWDDAAVVSFSVTDKVVVTARIKHDENNIVAAYTYVFIGEAALCFPEICLDTDHDQSPTWQLDDWWFHVSGTDCEARGAYAVWGDCSVVQPDWQGVPNFAMVPEPPPLDTFEIRIPLSKIGVAVGDTIGIGFDVEYIPTEYGLWPEGMSMDNPSTWGTAVIEPWPH